MDSEELNILQDEVQKYQKKYQEKSSQLRDSYQTEQNLKDQLSKFQKELSRERQAAKARSQASGYPMDS